jgi:tripartite motif-containing protein 71
MNVKLSANANIINIESTAQDGITKKTYTFNISKLIPPPLSSGGGGGFVISPPSSEIVITTDGLLTLPVGKSGKTSIDNILTVYIPANATDKDLKLTIQKLSETQSLLKKHEKLLSPVYEILKNFPENFNYSVTLTLAFDPASLTGEQKVAVYYYNEDKQLWVEVSGGKIDGNMISVEVNHFTKYAVMIVDQQPVIHDNLLKSFNDISSHWAEVSINKAVGNGIISGYPDGTFKPDVTVTREEFAMMLMNVIKPQTEGVALTFSDSAMIGAWAQKAVALSVQTGLINGYEDGSFRPNADITRAEMAVIIAKALGHSNVGNASIDFLDEQDIPAWAKGSVAFVQHKGIVQGNNNNNFLPNDHATRAEAVKVLLNFQAISNNLVDFHME